MVCGMQMKSLKQDGHKVMTGKSKFETVIARLAGESIETLRSVPMDERQLAVEARHGARLKITSKYCSVRGSVLHDRLIDSAQLEEIVDQALEA